MSRAIAGVIALGLCLVGCVSIHDMGGNTEPHRRATLDGPLVIAHRGASAYLPEHTLEAYTLAHAMGADIIEPDVVFTKDRTAICAHDITMQDVTDVEQKFPDRARPDGSWYWIDFTLPEIKTLNKTGRRSPLDSEDTTGYTVATLDEMINLIHRLDQFGHGGSEADNVTRSTRLIPELKNPAFYTEYAPGFDPAAALVEAIGRHGSAAEHSIIQCFDLDTIEYLATITNLRLVWLTSETPTPDQLDRARAVCHGLGPNRALLEDDACAPKPLLAEAKRRGLALYPWTFKDEPEAVSRFFHRHGVDGLFTDNPDTALAARSRTR